MAYSPDGKRIVSGRGDKVMMGGAAEGQKLVPLTRYTSVFNSVAERRDGKRIVTGSGDNTVKVWAAERGQTPMPLKRTTGAGRRVA